MDAIYTQLQAFGKVKANVLMSKLTTFKIGGPAKYVLEVTDTAHFIDALNLVRGEGIPYMILGGGSNMLAPDEGFDGVVIQPRTKGVSVEGEMLTADAGCVTVEIAHESIKAGLTGFEWGVGVPGTIGGAVRGNAGAMGKEMKDDVHSVEVYRDGEVLTLQAADLNFGYRHSIFKTNEDIILRVTLSLTKATDPDGMKRALSFLKYRNETQPKGWASTGCIFKNPDFKKNKEALLAHANSDEDRIQKFEEVGKISAGWLVQESGMKGKKIGNAEVSETHGNFIINLGEATSHDVLSLIEEVKAQVYTTFGIELEEEIHIIH